MLLCTAANDKQKDGRSAKAGAAGNRWNTGEQLQVELREASLIHNLRSALLLCSNENRGILVALAAK